MKFLECDDMMENELGYCAADHVYCSDNRMRCKKADDFYFKQDGQHYYQRFVVYNKKEYDKEIKKFKKSYVLRDFNGDFKDLPLVNKEDAYSLIYFLYQVCDIIDELGGYSEYLPHKKNTKEYHLIEKQDSNFIMHPKDMEILTSLFEEYNVETIDDLYIAICDLQKKQKKCITQLKKENKILKERLLNKDCVNIHNNVVDEIINSIWNLYQLRGELKKDIIK